MTMQSAPTPLSGFRCGRPVPNVIPRDLDGRPAERRTATAIGDFAEMLGFPDLAARQYRFALRLSAIAEKRASE